MHVTIVIPTFNEGLNVAEIVRRIAAISDEVSIGVLFVDDSTDDTPSVIEAVTAEAKIPIKMLHRAENVGGLGGAVVAGLIAAESDVCVVMDGDLQHPPEVILDLVKRYEAGNVDVVVASRYVTDGESAGLADTLRVIVSHLSTALAKSMFPVRLKGVTDPMTGFFLVDRRTVGIESLKPRGFKILLEILARKQQRVAEVPLIFGERFAGSSKANLRQGLDYLAQLIALRFGKMSRFALVGGFGAVVNIGIVWAMSHLGFADLAAIIVAAETTIIGNFFLQEHFVFGDMRTDASGARTRFLRSFTFNNAELLIRIPVTTLLISSWHISVAIATAITLVVAFFARFLFHALVVYAPRRTRERPSPDATADSGDSDQLRVIQ